MKKFIVLLVLLLSQQAYARFLFDGHAGYGFTVDQEDENKLNFKGIEIGVRLGPTLGPLILGVDASFGWMKAESEVFPSISDIYMKKYDLGGFIGFEFLKLLRVWGSYYVVSEMSFDYIGSPKLKGTAAGGGVGLTIIPFVTFNGEVKFYNMNKLTVSGNSTDLTGDQKNEPIEVIFTIGFIF